VNGKLVDTSYRVESDADIAIVTPKSPEGLDILRHSTSHLMAQAVQELFPGAQVTIGPVIENGFYYDFAYKRPFTPEDLVAIEKRMAELAKKDMKVERKVMARDEAVKFFNSNRRENTKPRSSPRSRTRRPSRSTARATGSTCAADRMYRQRGS
jgi:threonyl-tRNA synthetase